ncbi:MAG: LemA family protein [Candidatus Omnitrophica bacterium]|nr:LemA family protein [Candidatus Omnitrophota bacterium]
MELIYIVGGVLFVLLLFIAATYNGLVRMRNQVRESWSGIDTELQRRYDLIPNLVKTVKAYAKHERELLEEVTRLRNVCAQNRGTPEQQARSENELVGVLGRLFAVSENYPDLKADQNFRELQDELVNTEDRIQAARRFFNGNVRELNTKVESFPSNLIANSFGFQKEEYFEISDFAVRQAPKVDLSPEGAAE